MVGVRTDDIIKVIVVDDSPFMRKILTDILNSDANINVIGTARNGREAVDIVGRLKPDVVTLDIEMPIMNGIDALKNIMEFHPVPIVMLSGLTFEGGKATMRALELGAIDFIQKPTNIFKTNSSDLKNEIIGKIKAAHYAKIIQKSDLAAKLKGPPPIKGFKPRTPMQGVHRVNNLIAIAVSTGGPRALQHIIPLIPKNFPASFLVVQHMPKGFTKILAERLDSLSQVNVKEAKDKEEIREGHVYVAPGDYHLEIVENQARNLFVQLSQKELVSGHRPSADVMFRSISNLKANHMNIMGVIMTGMGSDGTKGLVELKSRTSAHIVAQDEASSVVFGMPKSAINAGIVDEIVPLEKILDVIVNRVGVS